MNNTTFNKKQFCEAIFNKSSENVNELMVELFHYQYQNNELYRQFCDILNKGKVESIEGVPFLPIRFFKSHVIKTGNWDENKTISFTSSGTTGSQTSRHYVPDISIYEDSFIKGFDHFYGSIKEYTILGLLPSYLERESNPEDPLGGGSSLIYMVNKLMEISSSPDNGFYLNDEEKLFQKLKLLEEKKQKTILLGVSFALLDFAEKFTLPLEHTLIMETGGMKGRKKEITREELHSIYKSSFGNTSIHSEYGMTELLSQAYSKGEGKFHAPPWMKIIITAIDDPFKILAPNQTGRINIMDLANIDSIGFIATDDLGKLNSDGSFEVLGRLDNSSLRGCNLLI